MWQAFIGPIADLIGEYIENRRMEAKAKHEARLQVIQHDADWETKMAEASGASWKDEWWTICLSFPLVAIGWGVFTNDPSIMDRVHVGFDALSDLPDFYTYLLFLAVSASFGIRGADRLMKMREKK
jgi:hypothetical protein